MFAGAKGCYNTHNLICKFSISNLFITLDYVLQKASTGDNPHYLNVLQPAHHGNADAANKLVSISFYSYASIVISVLNSIFYRMIFRGVEEDPQAKARRHEVDTHQS
jgi:hypothetical protein